MLRAECTFAEYMLLLMVVLNNGDHPEMIGNQYEQLLTRALLGFKRCKLPSISLLCDHQINNFIRALNMATDFAFRKKAMKELPTSTGVYVLCDLDEVPIYVGQSKDGIRARVSRHLTSARSDIIANRQIDVWEIAYVWAFPISRLVDITPTENRLYHHYNKKSKLMNGTVPPIPPKAPIPKPSVQVQVMSDKEIAERKTPEQRLPRQANHYAQIVGHFLAVKNSTQIAGAMDAHFARLKNYHTKLIESAVSYADDAPEA
jgi:Uri superfamily endonuclease